MTAVKSEHRQRLEELLKLAQTYRGCNRRQLAKELSRDPSNLVPDSGIPKIDLVVNLANILDWPVEDVVDALWNGHVQGSPPEAADDFTTLDRAAADAHRNGQYREMVEIASRAYKKASTADERVRACNREAGGWDGLGRYRNALEVLQRGLRESDAEPDRQLLLRSNLANAHYTLWQLYEGQGVAGDVIEWIKQKPELTLPARIALGTAHYVRGNCYRRLISAQTNDRDQLAAMARKDLIAGRNVYLELAAEHNDSYAGIANTCLGGLMEVDVVLQKRDARGVLEEFTEALEALVDIENGPVGDWLESYGWWCIFGCNVALRHVRDDRELQQRMAVFTNKADEIAKCLGNWSIRERVFTMEYARRQRFMDWTGIESDWTIDNEDVRVIAGTMGRFPEFRDTAWRILRTAKFIGKN